MTHQGTKVQLTSVVERRRSKARRPARMELLFVVSIAFEKGFESEASVAKIGEGLCGVIGVIENCVIATGCGSMVEIGAEERLECMCRVARWINQIGWRCRFESWNMNRTSQTHHTA